MTKPDFDDKLKRLNKKVNSNKTKHFLVENKLKKLQPFHPIYFREESQFEEDDTQNFLVFKPMHRSFKRVGNGGTGNYIYF